MTTLTPTLNFASSTLLFVDATLETGAAAAADAAADAADCGTADAVVVAVAGKTLLGPESSSEMSSKLGTLTFWKCARHQKYYF